MGCYLETYFLNHVFKMVKWMKVLSKKMTCLGHSSRWLHETQNLEMIYISRMEEVLLLSLSYISYTTSKSIDKGFNYHERKIMLSIAIESRSIMSLVHCVYWFSCSPFNTQPMHNWEISWQKILNLPAELVQIERILSFEKTQLDWIFIAKEDCKTKR